MGLQGQEGRLGLGCVGPGLRWFASTRQDRPHESPFCREHHGLLLRGAGGAHQAQEEGWGGRVLEALASERVAVLMEDFTFIAGEEDTRVLVEGLVVLKGDLTTVSTEVLVEKLSVRLEGEKEGAPVQFPPDRRPAKPLADASCCASMQRSVASADIIVMEGWGRKG